MRFAHRWGQLYPLSTMKTLLFAGLCALALPIPAAAQEWSQPVRGSWVRSDGPSQPGDVILAGTSILYKVSVDGANWVPVNSGSNLTGLLGPSIRINASLTTTNTSLSPRILSMEVIYEYFDALWSASITPPAWSGTAGVG